MCVDDKKSYLFQVNIIFWDEFYYSILKLHRTYNYALAVITIITHILSVDRADDEDHQLEYSEDQSVFRG